MPILAHVVQGCQASSMENDASYSPLRRILLPPPCLSEHPPMSKRRLAPSWLPHAHLPSPSLTPISPISPPFQVQRRRVSRSRWSSNRLGLAGSAIESTCWFAEDFATAWRVVTSTRPGGGSGAPGGASDRMNTFRVETQLKNWLSCLWVRCRGELVCGEHLLEKSWKLTSTCQQCQQLT